MSTMYSAFSEAMASGNNGDFIPAWNVKSAPSPFGDATSALRLASRDALWVYNRIPEEWPSVQRNAAAIREFRDIMSYLLTDDNRTAKQRRRLIEAIKIRLSGWMTVNPDEDYAPIMEMIAF